MSGRRCPGPGCTNTRDRGKAFCRSCWYSIPKPVRDNLWRAYRGPGVFSDEYDQAHTACVEALER